MMTAAAVRQTITRSSRTLLARRSLVTQRVAHRSVSNGLYFLTASAAVVATGVLSLQLEPTITQLDSKVPTSGDVLMLGPIKEKATGILFPQLCNAMSLMGTGVRVKWGLIKVYAVGTYMDPLALSGIKNQGKDAIEKALLNPMYPRTIRIVMARGLSIEKYTGAIVEALEPRMNGEDLDKLEEFKKLNPPVDLVEGAEMEMTIRGNTLLYKNATGGVGQISSAVFCSALCDVYYGADAVSPTHKDSVIEGISKS